jgi:hypothetical protein
MRPLDMPIRWSIGLAAVLLAALPGVAGRALAHGAPEKVIDERFVVTVALAPDGDLTRLRFFFRDFQTGRGLTEPMSVRVRIAEDEAPTPLHDQRAAVVGSWADVLYQFPHDGFYEVVLEFSLDAEPARVYRPEDWRIWVGKPRALDGRTWAWVTGTSTLLTMMVVLFLRRPRTEWGGAR